MRFRAALIAIAPLLPALALAAPAAKAPPKPGNVRHFSQQDGAALYRGVCQGCHMPDGKGAVGAGKYPSLGANPNLEAGGYAATLIINGQKAMPPLGPYLSDQQVAAVVDYVRAHFGNAYASPVTLEEVRAARPQ